MMPAELLVAVVGVFVTVAIGSATAASWVLERNAPERRRIRDLTARPGSTPMATSGAIVGEDLDPVLARLSRLMPKSPGQMKRLQRQLTRAGFPYGRHVALYSAAELFLPLALGFVALIIAGPRLWPVALAAAAVGYVLPSLFIGHKMRERQKAIQNGLPDALDLLTVCVEAGSALDQALVRASEELALAHPALAEELRIITTETRAGKPRMEAFKNFAQRTGVEDVRTLVAMLLQTDRFGTSVAQALRTHSETSRTKRRQMAEERAGKIAVKLVFPLALCLFPALYVVCFGPVVVKIYRAFFTGGI